MIRDYFLGGNTNEGFYSYYQYLAEPEDFNKIYIIKGGPGTGKSSFMKAVAKWGTEKGFDVDRIHCSSDPDSLDGVVISQIKIAMVDGTSPHIVDPKVPGAVEVIVNMGDFWDEAAIKSSKKEIMECSREITENFSKAYRFLESAGNLRNNCRACVDKTYTNSVISQIVADLHFASGTGKGRVRKLFAEGITPQGIISFADTFDYEKRIVLKSDNEANLLFVLEKVQSKICEMGYDHEVFYSPFNPEKEIRHIVIPEENICILTSDMYSLVPESNATVFDIDGETGCIGREQLKCRLLEMTLVGKGVQKIAEAKKLHDKLENYYSPHVDFDAVGKMKRRIFDQLEEYAQEYCDENKMI